MGSNTENLCVPFYEPSSRITGRADTPVIGKRFVKVSAAKDPGSRELDPGATGGNVRIVLAAAFDRTLGVAEHDAAAGKTTTVLCGGFTVPVTAETAITAGMPIGAGTDGMAVDAGAGLVAGIALADAAAGEDAIVKLV